MTEKVRCGAASVMRAAQLLRNGGVVAFPTDTVYGVGCDPFDKMAVRRIYEIKGRDHSKPLPVLVSSTDVAASIAEMNPVAASLAARYWPGPLTLILKVTDASLTASMGLAGSVAVRVPGGRCVSMLLEACNMLVGTSANPSGKPSPISAHDVNIECDMLLDGGIIHDGVESTIVDARTNNAQVVRRGAAVITP